MLEDLDRTKLAQQQVDIEQLKRRIASGNAIVFTGAGFSMGTTNILDTTPPMAKELAKKLSQLAKLEEESDDLMLASEMALELAKHDDILDLLKDNYTLKKVSGIHETICSLPWKRFYTTNYDNSIELASLNISKRIESLSTSSNPIDFIKKPNVCIHVNGKIEGSVVNDLKSKIKLSDASYLSADSFVNSKWNYHFKRDLERASAIVFLGYSMYDIDVKKILFENPELAEKTYFVVRDGASFQETFMIKRFGHVLPIGVENFAELVENIQKVEDFDEFNPESLTKYELYDDSVDIRDADSEKFLLFGSYSPELIQSSLIDAKNIPFVAKRAYITDCLDHINDGKNLIIQGDLGNGKSIFLESLAFNLTVNGHNVYYLDNNDGDYVADIESIDALGTSSIVIVDDFSNFLPLLEYFQESKPENIQLVLSERNVSYLSEVKGIDVDFLEINIDLLTDDEIEGVIEIIDNLGAWNEFSSLNDDKKIQKVKYKYNCQLSSLLLGLLDSPNIKQKIKKQTDVLYENESFKQTVFAICLSEVVNAEPTSSLISELIDNNEIYCTGLRSSKEFKTLFKIENNTIKSKSSLLALSLLNNTFSETYIMDNLLDVTKRLDSKKGQDSGFEKIMTSLLRFRFVEMILPQKKSILNRYYERLKVECSWLMRSPHYWVQYAMCRLAYNDYKKAQDYLTTAYEQARSKNRIYYTDNIDTQQARLYLNQSVNVNDATQSYKFFEDAHKLLASLPNDGRKFRQAILYKDVYEKKYDLYTEKYKVAFEHATRKILEQANNGDLDPRTIHHAKQMRFISEAKQAMTEILESILESRK
ncbi:SIR2 family protein [Vibrio europaeus]|uniref:SIR2 family protein n=1 Tax=Vibrio europaeus TaxID=300876 RepID=UPI00233E818E|nr:SIR2 family protein [Vibrio europaeus]MDC5819458.1 SIR2 family protein [Vibrio europaeus]